MGLSLQTFHTVESALAWLRARQAESLTLDSRSLRAGDAWLAWPGARQDPREFVPQALQNGARACLLEAKDFSASVLGEIDSNAVALMADLQTHAGEIASQFWGQPSHQLRMVAVTGTNGKTSCAWWIAQALSVLSERCGVIGTLGVGEPGAALVGIGLTTPDAVTLQKHLARMRDAGFKACVIEASSIGIAQGRLNGMRLDIPVFTNFTQDHLDYHGDMESYWQAKAGLFAWPDLKTAVINGDDPRGFNLVHSLLKSTRMPIWAYSSHNKTANLLAQKMRFEKGEMHLSVRECNDVAEVRAPVIGEHNALNILAVMGVLRGLGYSLPDAARACSQLTPVPGRMEWVRLNAAMLDQAEAALPKVVVDYAHTPDALEKALLALQPLAKERGGQLWCVFGCGGNRDAGKRPLMGAVAERCAQRVIVTSDNPRGESAESIASQIVAGLSSNAAQRTPSILDRAEAIACAITQAQTQDLVLIAGKGHETTQEIQGEIKPFSDVAHAQAALARRLEPCLGAAHSSLPSTSNLRTFST
jgi:UDP-N-acetylmuramoyl-L-alanyl-D-glutamate--2,6-diaminopimelate ligase